MDTEAADPEARVQAAWPRIERAVACLNAGDADVLLEGYVDDVVVAPLTEIEDPDTDYILHGKAAYKRYLLAFLAHHGGFEMTDLAIVGAQAVVSVRTRSGERKRLTVTLDEAGRGTRVVIVTVP